MNKNSYTELILIPLILLFLMGNNSFGQEMVLKSAANKTSLRIVENLWNLARQQDKSLAGLHHQDKELITGTDGGGSLRGYFKKGHLIVADVCIGLSNKETCTRIYFPAQNVFYKQTDRYYAFDYQRGELDPSKIVSNEEWFYVENSGRCWIVSPITASKTTNREATSVKRRFLYFLKQKVPDWLATHEHTVDISDWLAR